MIVSHRLMEAHDQVFVIDNWIKSFRTSHHAGLIHMDDWRAVMWAQVERILFAPDVRTLVAHDAETTDHVADLLGFITVDTERRPPLVYYVYVKEYYRQGGIARGLFRAAGVDPSRLFHYACKTGACSRLARKIPFAKWAPLAARHNKERPDYE